MVTAMAPGVAAEQPPRNEAVMSAQPCVLCAKTASSVLAGGVRDYEYGAPGTFCWLRCDVCGLVRLDPTPTGETLALAYPRGYHAYHEPESQLVSWYVSKRRRARARALARLLPPGGTILDIGCGSGALLEQVGRHGSFRLLGVEYRPEAARTARRRGATVWTGELDDADIPEQTVDLIVMEHVLEHVSDALSTLRRIHALLKPGGVVLGETPNLRCPDMRLFGRYWGGGHAPRHLWLFTPGALRDMLEKAGLRHVHLTHPVYPAHMSLSIQNWLRRWRTNTDGLTRGRAWYYPWLCIASMPAAVLASILRCSGAIRFRARRPA